MSKPFNPQDFGWQEDLPGKVWILRRPGYPPNVVGCLNYHAYKVPCFDLSLNLTGDMHTVYRGAIPDTEFALVLFANIAASLDPEEEADLIGVLSGSRPGSDCPLHTEN